MTHTNPRRPKKDEVPAAAPLHLQFDHLRQSPECLSELKAYCEEHSIHLVIVDTLSRFWNVKDENDNAEVERAISPLVDWTRETGRTLLLIHHDRKSGGRGLAAARGGGALGALVDQAFQLYKPPKPKRNGAHNFDPFVRYLACEGRYGETPRSMTLRYDETNYTVVGRGDTGQAPQRSAGDVVWAALSDETPVTEDQLIGQCAPLGRTAVRKAIAALGRRYRLVNLGTNRV